jgi:hypothetical protein
MCIPPLWLAFAQWANAHYFFCPSSTLSSSPTTVIKQKIKTKITTNLSRGNLIGKPYFANLIKQ